MIKKTADAKTDKENYRPISILPNISTVDERLMYNLMYTYSNEIYSKLLCDFCQGYKAE